MFSFFFACLYLNSSTESDLSSIYVYILKTIYANMKNAPGPEQTDTYSDLTTFRCGSLCEADIQRTVPRVSIKPTQGLPPPAE